MVGPCSKCRFFDPAPGPKGPVSVAVGLCRRNAPQRASIFKEGLETRFPVVLDNDWCGQYEMKPTPTVSSN